MSAHDPEAFERGLSALSDFAAAHADAGYALNALLADYQPRKRRGPSLAYQESIRGRNEMLVQLWRTWRPGQGPRATAMEIASAMRRYRRRFLSDREKPRIPVEEPHQTLYRLMSAGHEGLKEGTIYKILLDEEEKMKVVRE